MIKRINKIITLVTITTIVTTLSSSPIAFASDALQEKDGNFNASVAYSNKYLYDGYRGTDGEEQTIYYNNGKYNELENSDAYDDSIKYDNRYIELDNNGKEDLFNLQTGKFEGEDIEDQKFDIRRDLVKKLKETNRYGSNITDYLQLGDRISSNKGSFGDVWYKYTADYNYGQAIKYVTIINLAANSNDEWDNITLKKGDGITSDFGDSYQFWFSVTSNDPTNKETDGIEKTYNGDITAASKYIAKRLKDYCGYDAEVTTENGSPVIQIISDEKLEGTVITGHNSDISIESKMALAKNIQYVSDDTKNSNGAVRDMIADNYISKTVESVYGTTTTDSAVKYTTTIDINAESDHEWRNITLKKGDDVTSSFGDTYQFWFSITADESGNLESDGEAKTYNGDVEATAEYIAGRIRDYCGYGAQVIEQDGKPVIQIKSDTKIDGNIIISYDDNILVKTEENSSSTDEDDRGNSGNSSGEDAPSGSETDNEDGDNNSGTNSGENTTGSDTNTGEETSSGTHAIINYDKEPIYYGFVNNSGKYMDVSKFANIKLIYTVNGETKTEKIEKFGEKYGNENIVANLTDVGSDLLTQDSTYIYVSANVEFTSDSDISIAYPDGTNSKKYILKISKAVGDKVDGADTPKEVTAYEMNGESDFLSWIQPKLSNDWYNLDVCAKNGNIYVIRFNKDGGNNKIQVNQVGFETVRDDDLKVSRNKIYKVNDPSIETRIKGQKLTVTDAGEIRNLIRPYYSIDAKGNLWVLGLKKIYEFNGNGFDEKYTIPAKISNLDVYDGNNLIAWGDNGTEYGYVTNINEFSSTSDEKDLGTENNGNEGNGGEGSTSDKDNTSSDESVIKSGWIKTKSGWQFFDESGKQVKDSWIKVNEKWYVIDENGIMRTGWINISGKWYYLNSDGSMATGWMQEGSSWYYLQSDGEMSTGWVNDDGNWYYLKESGEMSIGWISNNGNWYHLGTDGSMSTGWLKYGKHWYYLDENGKMLSDATMNGYKLGTDGVLI
jgi:FOG: Glucan-binding domain (YG repeat)